MQKNRNFIPFDLKVNEWSDLQPFFEKLLKDDPDSLADLEQLIQNYSDTSAVFGEQYAWSYINMSCHTDNKEYVQRYEKFSTEIQPEVSKIANQIDKKIASHNLFPQLPAERYGQLVLHLQRDLDLFRDENVPLNAQISKLSSQYDQTTGGLTTTIDGENLTMPQAGIKLQSSDRGLRERAWKAIQATRYEVRDKLNDIFDQMTKLRHQIALNAGYENYRDYKHDDLHRFDYTPEDAGKFHDAIEKYVVPLAREITLQQRNKLNLAEDDFMPWDTAGVPADEEPLKPFTSGKELLESSVNIFSKLYPEFGENLRKMDKANLFDLESRKGKAPGGYNYPLEVTGMPFIFMNAAGAQRDVVTMMHEGGHAMHTFLTQDEPLGIYRDTPSEMAETASMSMELMTADKWREFYSEADFIRARKEHLEGVISFFPWCAIVDALQHWIYLNPEHTADEREQAFLDLNKRFGTGLINWEGFENLRRNTWQRQPHIFGVPFYYIEYGIAQLGALQVYRNFKQDPQKALEGYIAGLSLGSSKPLPEVWAAMNIKFDFSADVIKELMEMVQAELAELYKS